MSSEKEHHKNAGKGTRSVHSGTSPSENSLNTPVYQSSTFFLDDNSYEMWIYYLQGKKQRHLYFENYVLFKLETG